jgi:hypothetical protein
MNKTVRSNLYNHQAALAAALMVLIVLLTACQISPVSNPVPSPSNTALPTSTLPASTPAVDAPVAQPTATQAHSAEVYDPANPESWVYLPVIPETVSQRVRDLYETGKTSGLDQQAFSKVGDCETFSPYFLAPFDMNKKGYRLGQYASLDTVITSYAGSFERTSMAAKSGFSVASVLSPVWADPTSCRSGETPLVCEIRIQRPAIMLVMFGTNDVKTSSRAGFEANLKRLLDIALLNNEVPVLVTKADNLEGDGSINAIIARVAWEYELPVLNLWRAMQELPDGGLMPDQIHLTYAQPFFDEPANMQMGWPVRNLVTLQMLEFLHNELH